jgi:transglutaminase-like putative cysteine protease
MKSILVALAFVLCTFQVSIAQKYKFGKISKEEIQQKQHPQDPTADAAILYRETKTDFQYTQDDGFYMITDYFERVKIYNKEGFDWGNVTIDLYKSDSKEDKLTGLKAYTYYLDTNGKIEDVKLRNDGIFEEENSKYLDQTKFTMPDLREGCVIEYKYTIKSPYISNIDEFKFQEDVPVDKVVVRFASPEYFVFKTHQRGWVPYKVNSETRDRTISYRQTTKNLGAFEGDGISHTNTRNVTFKENIYNINLENVPAMKEEAYAGNIDNYATALKFELSYIDFPGSPLQTFSTTWEDVSKGIYKVDSFGNELKKDNYYEDDIDNLLNGISNPTEKMAHVFEYVRTKMNWNSYNGYYTHEGVKEAYKKETGNVAEINLMLVSMLRHAGLQANPVLVSTKSHGIPLFPTRNGFNYVIAAVEMPQGVYLFDATNKDAEIGVLKPSILNWQGRIIRKDGSSGWVSLTPSAPAVKSAMMNMDIAPDLSVTGNVKNRFTGNYAFSYRTDYKSLNEDARRKQLEKKSSQAELSNLKFENLETTGKPVSLEYDFNALDAVENVAGKLYFSPMVFMATKENPFKPDTRQYPIDYGFPMKDRYIVTINLPEGYKVESMPENALLNLGEGMGSFRYVLSQMGNKLQLSVEFAMNKPYIAAADYANLKKFYELLIAKENEKVVLSKV